MPRYVAGSKKREEEILDANRKAFEFLTCRFVSRHSQRRILHRAFRRLLSKKRREKHSECHEGGEGRRERERRSQRDHYCLDLVTVVDKKHGAPRSAHTVCAPRPHRNSHYYSPWKLEDARQRRRGTRRSRCTRGH